MISKENIVSVRAGPSLVRFLVLQPLKSHFTFGHSAYIYMVSPRLCRGRLELIGSTKGF